MLDLKLRCKDGRRIVETFKPTDTFQQVLNKINMEDSNFMSTFPKKVYGIEEREKTLEELGKQSQV